jgi:MFS family permease
MARTALLTPLKHRDFALLWAGMTVSLLGDGIYFVAIAWEVYALSDDPASLALVGLAWSLGMVAFLLVGGSVADRVDRRMQMVTADLVRLVAVAAMGLLTVTGAVAVWHLVALSLLFGIGEAFFSPAFSALIPQLVPRERLVQANALQQIVRPAAYRLAGPALGGVLVALVGAGTAFLIDAGTFVAAIACVALIRARPAGLHQSVRAVHGGVREGFGWARTQAWFWATLLMAALGIMLTVGPQEVLLPYIIRHEMHEPASAFGLVLAAGGVGGIGGGLVMGSRPLPARPLRFMYAWWALATVVIAGYAVATTIWQLAVLTFLFGLGIACGMVVWATLMQTRVPPEMLGRVSALDWVVSIGLSPVSFALTAPVVALAGTDATLLGGGLVGGAVTLLTYALVPGLRADDARASASSEGQQVREEPRVPHGRGVHADDLDALA